MADRYNGSNTKAGELTAGYLYRPAIDSMLKNPSARTLFFARPNVPF
jgi:hypothetical protein